MKVVTSRAHSKLQLLLSGAVIAGALAAADQSWAQGAAPSIPSSPQTASTQPPGAAPVAQVQEVVVTAERRESTVQRTAATVDVVGSAQLQRQRIVEFTDLNSVLLDTQIVPIVGQTQVTIRGIGSNFIDPRADPAVSTSLNGLFFDRPLPLGFSFLDISRVEDLEGPQGTLYGRNSAAGALNIITNQPSQRFGGFVQATGGNLGANEFTGALNVPLTDTLAVRVAYDHDRRDGYIGGYYDDVNNDTGRIIVKWQPIAPLTVSLESDYINIGGHGGFSESYPCAPSQAWSLTDPKGCPPAGLRSGLAPTNGREGSYISADQIHVDYNLGWATLTSISGFVGTHEHFFNLPDGSAFTATQTEDNYDYSEELRLAGHDSANHRGGFAWQVGTYLFNSTGNYNYVVNAGSPLPPTGTTDYSKLPQSSEAGYAQATYGLTNSLRLTGGVRVTHDFKGVTSEATNIQGLHTGRATDKNTKATYKGGLEYDLAPGKLLYGTVSTGYVAGGANGGNPGVPLAANITPSIFQPETITSYEIGSKNRFLNNRLQLNGDVYYENFDNFQYQYPSLVQGGGTVEALYIQNASSVTAYGVELSADFALTPDDRLSASFSYSHGRFGALVFAAFTPPFGPAMTVSRPSGSAVPNDPDESALVGYEHTWRLSGNSSITASANTHISSKYLLVVGSTDPYDFQKGYAMTDASIAYHWTDKYIIRLFAKNLENVPVNVYGQGATYHLYGIEPPRTYGVTVTANF